MHLCELNLVLCNLRTVVYFTSHEMIVLVNSCIIVANSIVKMIEIAGKIAKNFILILWVINTDNFLSRAWKIILAISNRD